MIGYGLMVLPLMLHRLVRHQTQGRTQAMSYVTLAGVTTYTILLSIGAVWLF
jgi:hypothetical protein